MTADDVKSEILRYSQPDRAAVLARFFQTGPGQYGFGDQFLGLTMPQQHRIARQHSQLPPADVETLVRDPYHECRMVGLQIWMLQARRGEPGVQVDLLARYLANRAYINNWDLVDVSCPYLVGQPLLRTDRSVLYELAQEDHLWSQRMAIIATLAFIRQGQFADTFAIAELLLTHKHDLIHKAIGWMLREAGKRNADALDEFLHDNGPRMPRTALRYAIERFSPDRRQYYLNR